MLQHAVPPHSLSSFRVSAPSRGQPWRYSKQSTPPFLHNNPDYRRNCCCRLNRSCPSFPIIQGCHTPNSQRKCRASPLDPIPTLLLKEAAGRDIDTPSSFAVSLIFSSSRGTVPFHSVSLASSCRATSMRIRALPLPNFPRSISTSV
jgi:hypothetical protein